MGHTWSKGYFPPGYDHYLSIVINRLKYTNQEDARKEYKLKSIIMADADDLMRRHFSSHLDGMTVTQAHFEQMENNFNALFVGGPEEQPADQAELPYADALKKFNKWFADALTNEATQTFLPPSTTKDEAIESISLKFKEVFANEAASIELAQLHAYVTREFSNYVVKYHDADSSALRALRREFAEKAAEGIKLMVLASFNHYQTQEQFIKANGADAWIMARKDLAKLRLSSDGGDYTLVVKATYETLVGYKIASFWRDLSQQPIDDMVAYYDKHKPVDIEKMFFDAHTDYNLKEAPEPLLLHYQIYC